ncbi:uncharacterized protein LOC134692407 [Mytilus trossulus]|uniref:uncharacterized protein LOC134692407 n=1 Tax=Mytilus trossulus TaxID=6551 RepID=UPI003004AC78
MSGEQLRDDLLKLFKQLADRSDRLIHIGTSQANESLNHIIATKAPKAKHFGGSESLNFRVAAGVAQLNCGRKYIVDVNENHGLSPGKVTITNTTRVFLDCRGQAVTVVSSMDRIFKRDLDAY